MALILIAIIALAAVIVWLNIHDRQMRIIEELRRQNLGPEQHHADDDRAREERQW